MSMTGVEQPNLVFQALEGTNKQVPAWLMRQAGRFLPEYRALRQKYSLEEMFRHPELVTEVTCMPVNLLKVDAAILFADILTLPAHSGFQVRFAKGVGPIIDNPIRSVDAIQELEEIPYLRTAIPGIRRNLPGHVPLIGFAGSPFTVLCYLVQEGGGPNAREVVRLARKVPGEYHKIMDRLTERTIQYLNLQKESGIQLFQLFDSWAGLLRRRDYAAWVLPYVQRIFQAVDLPSIYYLKGSRHLLEEMVHSGAKILSVCETVDFEKDTVLEQSGLGVQGNFLNTLFDAPRDVLDEEVTRMLTAAKKYRTYIFNLSHGILPDTDPEQVRYVLQKVREFPWTS